jgi:hypothetical protein
MTASNSLAAIYNCLPNATLMNGQDLGKIPVKQALNKQAGLATKDQTIR